MASSLKPSRFRFHNSGAILFLALWVLVALAILSLGISNRVTSEMYLTRRISDGVISLYLAKAAVNRAVLELEKDKTADYDTSYELQKTPEIKLGEASFISWITDEAGAININIASEAILSRLPGIDAELANKIATSSLKPFSVKEELLLVDGITPEIFSGFKDVITTFGDGKVNINTAPGTVLALLGLDSELVEIIESYRRGEDGEGLTEDDGIFENTGSIINSLRLHTLLSLDQEQQLLSLLSQNILSVNTTIPKINVETKIIGKTVKNYEIIIERSTGKIKFWQEA